ncbi:DUF1127 domain-containing protein [Tranquillimonas alkanivorans]|uniref:YjiS-like domain-containing protein n=1 Tax=Tranquillimonas alkanivorans TaxID=441119 RepID=A0A1I5LYT2_9RHOB|nr:DUF1127 domain-containing protein [Tranquillimonas alkanivorans]SFP02518.1 protein of unknown function [Tranquillimonas alkanivorans]
MAYANYSRTVEAGLLDRIASFLKDAGERLERYRLYRRTLTELDALSNRELADLGIGRSGIRRVAYEAAYQN